MGEATLRTAQSPATGIGRRDALWIACFATAYFFAHELAFLFPDTSNILMSIWPAGGIGLAALLLGPRRLWPAIAAALFISGNLADWLGGRPLALNAGFMTANVAESLVGAWLIYAMCGSRITFRRVRETLALICAATLVNALTATIGAGTARIVSGASFFEFWQNWWTVDAVGILLATPLIVAWAGKREPGAASAPVAAEAIAFFVLWCGLSWLVFNPHAIEGLALPPYLLVALLIWPALRLGLRGTTLALVVLGIIAVSSRSVIHGPLLWGGETATHRLLLAQIYIAVVAIAGLLLAASHSEVQHAEAAAREEQSRLRAVGDNLSDGAVFQVTRDLDGTMRFLHLSASVEKLYGVPVKAAMQDASLIYGRVHKDDLAPLEAATIASEREQSVFRAVVRYRMAEGGLRWMQIASTPRLQKDGRTLWDGVMMDVTDRKLAAERLERVNACLLSLGPDFAANVDRLTALCGELLGAACALYNKLDGELLCSLGQWRTPEGYQAIDKPDGHICYDVIRSGSDEVLVVRNLEATAYAASDPNVAKYGLKTYLGHVIRRAGEPVGSLCVVFQEDFKPSQDDKHILSLIASALSVEEGGREAENALRESEERLRLAAEAAEFGAYSLDFDGSRAFYSAEFLCRFGLPPGATLDLDQDGVALAVHPDDREEFRARIQAANDPSGTGLLDLEYRILLPDGKPRWLRVRGRTIFKRSGGSGKPFRANGIIQDITDRKLAEGRLSLSEERYRRLFEDAPIGIAFLGPEREFFLTKQKYRDFLGLSEEEIIRRGPAGLLHPDDLRRSVQLSDQLRSGEIPLVHLEQRHLLDDGELVWADTSIVAVRDQGGNLIHTIAWVQDISDRKRAEAENARLQDQLTQSQKMESVGRLAGGVAHDFNNMLCVIVGHAELAMQTTTPEAPWHADLEAILHAANRSADLTRQLLAFARRQPIAPRVLDLNEAVGGMMKMLRRLIGEDIELNWKPAEALWPVNVDPTQIDQILANLCVNSRDAIEGIGAIAIETGNHCFDEDYCAANAGFEAGEFVRLAVIDTGCGMDAETLAHVFEPFFTTKEAAKGTGLGLATVYGIAKQNNGFIDARSAPGKGTAFSIYLPRYRGAPKETAVRIGARPVEQGRETILLVEDQPAILKMTAMMLEMNGYNVLSAGSPNEAIELARRRDAVIHLLMTDVIMPEMNGRELSRVLMATHPELRVLFMSGYTADVIARHGVLEEGIHFIQKPFTMTDLAEKVRKALDIGAE